MSIAIEGTIGAGKTTVMNLLAERCPNQFGFCYEPIQKWTEDTTLLEDLYRDPKSHAFSFEVGSLVHLTPSCESSPLITVQERSIFAAYHVFSTLQHELGNISESEFQILTDLYHLCRRQSDVAGIFFIHLDSDTAYGRMCERGREAEVHVTKTYVSRVCELYDQVVTNGATTFSVPVKVVDGSRTPEQIVNELEKFIQANNFHRRQQSPPDLTIQVTKRISWSDGWGQ